MYFISTLSLKLGCAVTLFTHIILSLLIKFWHINTFLLTKCLLDAWFKFQAGFLNMMSTSISSCMVHRCRINLHLHAAVYLIHTITFSVTNVWLSSALFCSDLYLNVTTAQRFKGFILHWPIGGIAMYTCHLITLTRNLWKPSCREFKTQFIGSETTLQIPWTLIAFIPKLSGTSST